MVLPKIAPTNLFCHEKMQQLRVEDFITEHGEFLELKLLTPSISLKKTFKSPEVQRPGLSLAGFMKKFVDSRLIVFGNSEILYLEELSEKLQRERLEAVLTQQTPAAVTSAPSSDILRKVCEDRQIPLFRTKMSAMEFLNRASYRLRGDFSPRTTSHGTFIEAFGVGVLIQGDSSIGKSEAALGLLERGHRLISDDVVRLKRIENGEIEGFGPELNKHVMEIRGIGIINVAHLFGAVCVRESKSLDLIVKLEEWDDQAFYDRIGLDEKFIEMLGVNIPYHILPVKPGRDVVLLIETIVLNHRLKSMGYHSAREFNVKLLETISRKQKERESETHAES